MRTLPAGWPVSNGDDTTPEVYLHLLDSSWPPASDDCPAGYARVGSWNVDRDLVGSLLPGQVRAPSGFSVATGNATIPQSSGERLAPWKSGDRRVVPPARAELIASFDGPTGSTAFILGTFKVDPISGRMSEPNLSFELLEEWSSLKRPNTVRQIADMYGTPENPITGFTTDSSAYIEQIAADAGFAASVPTLGVTMTSIYFPQSVKGMEALQALVAAALGAALVDSTGAIKVLSYRDLVGAGTPVETLDVLTQFADLEWKIDPNEAVDRVEVKWGLPEYATGLSGATIPEQRASAAWVAAEASFLSIGATKSVDIDPGSAVGVFDLGFVDVNSAADGSGTNYTLTANGAQYDPSGRLTFTLENVFGVKLYFVNTDGKPSFLLAAWKDVSGDDASRSLVWGADEFTALNPISVDFGKLIQNETDARKALQRIVSRCQRAHWRITTVDVRVDLRRELGDLVWLEFPEEGLATKALITSVSVGGEPGGLTQTVDLAILDPVLADFNSAWSAAHPGATIADFNTKWSGKTIADLNLDPLST